MTTKIEKENASITELFINNATLENIVGKQNAQLIKENTVENTKILVIDIETDVAATPTLITFDKQKYIDIIDQMPLEQLTAGFFKKIEDAAITIDKALSEPIKAWRLEVKEIIAHGQSRIAELKRKEAEREAKRIAEKTTEVNELILKLKAGFNLPEKYLASIGFKTEYLQKGKTLPHIEADLVQQYETQAQLHKAELDAKENEILKIKNRELMVEKLNLEYGFTYTYSDFTIDRYTDTEVKDRISKDIVDKREKARALEQAEDKKIYDKLHFEKIEVEQARAEAKAKIEAEAQAKVFHHPIVTNPYPEPTPKYADKVFSRHIDLFCTDEVALEKAVTFIQSIILKNDTITITVLEGK